MSFGKRPSFSFLARSDTCSCQPPFPMPCSLPNGSHTTHAQPCHVVYTDFRPTPLQHYLFPQGGEGIHLVVDERGTFREDNFQKAMGALADSKGEDSADPNAGGGKRRGQVKKGGNGGKKGPSDIYKIVKMIMVKKLQPRHCLCLLQA